MGISADFTVIPVTEYRKHRSKPDTYLFPTTLAKFELYKEWGTLNSTFSRLPHPLGLAIRGDRPTHESFEDWEEVYTAFVTPGLVKKINKALQNLTDEDYIAALKARLKEIKTTLRTCEHRFYLTSLQKVRDAYQQAATEGAYLYIFIG